MNRRTLGKSEIELSEISLGTMSLPKDSTQSKRIIETAMEKGINYFDTADLYSFGENERMVGELIKERRSDLILGTKGGNHFEEGKDGWFWDPSKAYLKEACKNSLKRLGTDYIDLYQLHGGTIDDPIDESIEALQELKQEGYIREFGISSIRPNVIREYLQSGMASVMMQYSMLDRRPEEELLELLHQNGIGVLVRGAVAKGLLTDRVEEKVSEDGFLGHSKERILFATDALRAISDVATPSQEAIRYVLRHPAVTSVVAGASTAEQVLENSVTSELGPLSEENYDKLKKSAAMIYYEQHR
ncbi:aldo/keto reductase [Geomicrobium sediminis]|uniref:Aryl-alcohol dehydrogenase-like predicted oxidoreductase n=1 Tax=Geomicrobium sediminis TaxID=1347788 RepID=A0ABS2PE05_9BACL|nr:aldo/keto reductase [Geomicrobium sediminis]MBM7633361.1 aryl-alcohol dehydrogenase-like predicted oxidoreductase [Geomicrobium sediminis]